MNSIKLSRANPEVKELLNNTYPEYTGRKINLEQTDKYYLEDYWSGGTRY